MSTQRSRSSRQQSALDTIKSEGNSALLEKHNQINELNQKIDEAEHELAHIRAEIAMKVKNFASNPPNGTKNSEEDEQEITDLIKSNEEEIEFITKQQQTELDDLKNEYLRRLKTAERWADDHIATIVHEKKVALETLQEDLRNFRVEHQVLVEESAANTTKLQAQSKIASESHETRLKALEEQIANLTATTREEVRDVRHKINETVTTIGIRDREYQNQLAKYEEEYKRREQHYNEQIEAMQKQFEYEKSSLELAIKTAADVAQNAKRMQKRLDRFHEKQVDITMRDGQRLKNLMATQQAREESKFQQTLIMASNPHSFRQQCDQIKRELQIVNDETIELRRENERLLEELNRINKNLYGQD